MITFSIEPIANIWPNIVYDLTQNWTDKEKSVEGELNPKLAIYQLYEKTGSYFQYVARNEELVGYCGMYVIPSMRTQNLFAAEDILYIKPKYRGGLTAVKFTKFILQDLKSKGVRGIRCSVEKDNKAARVLKYLNFKYVSDNYEISLT